MRPQQVSATGPESLTESGLRRVLVVLCITQVTSWGVLYYAFPVLAPSIAADTGWSISAITAGFSTGLVVAALAGIPAGRWLDRWGPRPVMTTGSVIAIPAVIGIASAPTLPWYFAAWALAGVAMAGVLYQPAFAALTRWWGPRRVAALTVLTLLASLASTIFAPITAALVESLDWRQTYLVLVVVLAVVTIPAHFFGLRGGWPEPEPAAEVHRDPGAIARSHPFVLLVVAVALATFSAFAVVVNQVPLVLSGEENFDQYFGNAEQVTDPTAATRLGRYGLSGGASERKWERFDSRFDVPREPNEPNRFGWVVEIDPHDPSFVPRKRTALGRFKHEAAEPRLTRDGRVVLYMGDDERVRLPLQVRLHRHGPARRQRSRPRTQPDPARQRHPLRRPVHRHQPRL
jgi:hypothetical protein